MANGQSGLIYLDRKTQEKVLALFARSLHRDGFLVLGPRDGLVQTAGASGFVTLANGNHIYRYRRGIQA